jgi:glyoxylate carboligase
MSDEPWSVGRYIVALLAANGIDTVFGIPGVHNLELYRGLALTGLRHILVRHEQNAGFAADGFARASGQPAVAFVIFGARADEYADRRGAGENGFGSHADSGEYACRGFTGQGLRRAPRAR